VIIVMQGRLSPPIGNRMQAFPGAGWVDELPRVRQAGVDGIEWIYEPSVDGVDPFGLDGAEGDAALDDLRRRCDEAGVVVRSLVGDWFMQQPLARGPADGRAAAVARLRRLLGRCAYAGVEWIVLPFLDAVRIEEGQAALDDVAAAIEAVLPDAERHGVRLLLETSLPPERFAALLARLDTERVAVNYDSGNSASLGHPAKDDFDAYGKRIASIHVKDRVRGGATVPLTTGDADFDAVFTGLDALGYDGPFVLEVARGEPGNEVAKTAADAAFVRRYRPDA
jgi:hexulose-6-phosphate isomerase